MIARPIAVLWLALLPAVPAAAGEVSLSYQAVMHVTASHAAPVLGDASHLVGTGEFRGLAIFPEREIARHRYQGWFDLTGGSGRYEGYALWRFDDGSEIRAAYYGTARSVAAADYEVQARIKDISGTGRFAGASGEGSFSGRRFDAIEDGGTTYLTGTLSLRLPD